MANDFISNIQALGASNFLGSLVQEASATALAAKGEQVNKVIRGVGEELRLINSKGLQTTQQQLEEIGKNSEVNPQLQSIEDEALSYQKLQIEIANRQKEISEVFDKSTLALSAIGTPEANNAIQVLDKQKVDQLRMLANKGEIPERVAKFAEVQLNYSMSKMQFSDYFEAKKTKKELDQVEDFIVSHKIFEDMPAYGQEVYAGTSRGEKAMRDFDTGAKVITDAVIKQFPNLSPGVLKAAVNTMLTQYGKNLTVRQINPAELARARAQGDATAASKLELYNADMAALQGWTAEWNNKDQKLKNAIRDYHRGKATADALGYPETFLKEEVKKLQIIQESMDRAKTLYPNFIQRQYKDANNKVHGYGLTPIKGDDGVERLYHAAYYLDDKGERQLEADNDYLAIARFDSYEDVLDNKWLYNPYDFLQSRTERKKEGLQGTDKLDDGERDSTSFSEYFQLMREPKL